MKLKPAAITLLVLLAVGCRSVPREEPPVGPPDPSQPEPEPTGYFLYDVRRGDTLFSLGRRFGVPWRLIAEENEIADPNDLRVGSPLLIPRMPGLPAAEEEEAEPEQPPRRLERRPVAESDLHRGRPSSGFWWPTAGRVVRRYGDLFGGMPEPGIAIGAPAGTEVCAVADGQIITVKEAAQNAGSAWGGVVVVSHSGDFASFYGHLGRILVGEGDRVEQGQPIALVGSTGAAERPQLAFRLFRDEQLTNPDKHLP